MVMDGLQAIRMVVFIMADKNIIDDMIAQRIVFNDLKNDMIEHGVKFCEGVDNNKLKMEVVSNPIEPVLRINGVDVGKFEYNNEKTEYDIKYKYFDLIYVYNFEQKKEINEFVKNKLIELNGGGGSAHDYHPRSEILMDNDKTGLCTQVIDQIIKISKNTEVKLSSLRRMHRENNFSGQCVVFFDPELFSLVIEIPGFRHVDDYKYTKPVHEHEIGGVEVFHMVPASPIKYNVDIF